MTKTEHTFDMMPDDELRDTIFVLERLAPKDIGKKTSVPKVVEDYRAEHLCCKGTSVQACLIAALAERKRRGLAGAD